MWEKKKSVNLQPLTDKMLANEFRSSLTYWEWQRVFKLLRQLETKLSRTIMSTRINLVVNIIKNWQWRVWSWLRMNASGRPNTCKSRGNREKLAFPLTTGARVRNAYATYLLQEYSPEKFGLILHNILFMHMKKIKASVVKDGHAFY